MSDRHIRTLERVYDATQEWDDRVRLELARDRAGLAPGLGSVVEHEFPAASREPTKEFQFQTLWTGFIHPGLYRVHVQPTLKLTRWMIGLDLQNVSEWGRIEQTNGCLPRGALWATSNRAAKWMLRTDTCATFVVKLGQVKELTAPMGTPDGYELLGMWHDPRERVTDTMTLTLERVSVVGRAPRTGDFDLGFKKVNEAFLDISATMDLTQQRMRQAMYIPRNFMGGGAGSSSGMREIMSDPDVAEGFECEPGVGE